MIHLGNSNINEAKTYTEAVKARVSGIHIIVVSVGQQVNRLELRALASDPDDKNIFQVERFSQLQGLISQIPGAICDGRVYYIFIYSCSHFANKFQCVRKQNGNDMITK